MNVASLSSTVIFFIPPSTTTAVVRRMACAVYSLCTVPFYKGKGQTVTFLCKHRGKAEVELRPIRNPALEGGGWSAPLSFRWTRGKDTVRIVQEAGWASRRSGWYGRSRFHRLSIPGPSSPERVAIPTAQSRPPGLLRNYPFCLWSLCYWFWLNWQTS
jgi:hypothetical protein